MSSYDPFERMREIEIFGVPALFTDKAIPLEAVHPGMSRYELLAGDGGPEQPRYAAIQPGGKFLGTVLTPEAGSYTPAEFEEKYLSPDYDPQTQKERYGKEE